MCTEVSNQDENTAPLNITGDAVGVSKNEQKTSFWFIGYVTTNKEKRCREELEKQHYQVYLPTQQVTREWSQGRKRKIDRLVIPGYIFVRCTEAERTKIFSDPTIYPRIKPYLTRWMVNKASNVSEFGRHSIATIPDEEMQQFMEMVHKSSLPIVIDSSRFHKGDKIRITKGDLEGFIGELETLPDHSSRLVIRITHLGAAKVEIDAHDIEIINSKNDKTKNSRK